MVPLIINPIYTKNIMGIYWVPNPCNVPREFSPHPFPSFKATDGKFPIFPKQPSTRRTHGLGHKHPTWPALFRPRVLRWRNWKIGPCVTHATFRPLWEDMDASGVSRVTNSLETNRLTVSGPSLAVIRHFEKSPWFWLLFWSNFLQN